LFQGESLAFVCAVSNCNTEEVAATRDLRLGIPVNLLAHLVDSLNRVSLGLLWVDIKVEPVVMTIAVDTGSGVVRVSVGRRVPVGAKVGAVVVDI
jgi:hypothetical protein